MTRREFLTTPQPRTTSLRCSIVALAMLMAGCGIAAAQTTSSESSVNVPIPSHAAAREALKLSSEQSSLRFGGLDFFPYAAAGVRYDDNVLIDHSDRHDDVRWTLAPGLSVMGGDVATYVPGSVTVEQLRNYLYYSLADDLSKPKRFVGFDYSPAFNLYTDDSDLSHIDHYGKISAGYALPKTAFGLDADFARADLKNNTVGGLLTTTTYGAQLRGRYDITDRTWADAHLGFTGLDYEGRYQGYNEPELGLGLNRKFSDKLSVGLGAAAGVVLPERSDDQYYEQVLARAIYRLTGKFSLGASAGAEFRQYDADDQSGTTHPVFSISGLWQPTAVTSFTLEGHRRDQPSAFSGYNSETFGFTLGVRQLVFGRLYAGANVGYDFVEYRNTDRVQNTDRQDDYFNAGVNLSYDFNRNWRSSLSYTHRRNESNDDDRSYFNNIVGLDVLWRF